MQLFAFSDATWARSSGEGLTHSLAGASSLRRPLNRRYFGSQ
jgi:hypothetical protein